jgi:hypothetical protein
MSGGVMSEEFDLGEKQPHKTTSRPSWMYIVIAAVVVVGIVAIVLATRPQGAPAVTLETLNTKLTALDGKVAEVQTKMLQYRDTLQNEIGGLSTNVVGVELMMGSLADTLEELTGEVANLAIAVADIKAMLVACNCTAP